VPRPRETALVGSTTADVAAVIFDFDGLLIDTERVEADCIIEVVSGWGRSISYVDFGHLFGSVDADEQWDELLERWCGRTAKELDSRLQCLRPVVGPMKDALPLMPGVRKVLDRAHERRLRIGLGTGNTRETVQRRLGRHEIFQRFDAIVTRAEVTAGKPAPDIYLEVARRLAVSPELCLVLEDSVHGCEAALAAGMRVIACPTVVTEHCRYPTGVELVSSLLQVAL
jgi:HAD superfamily hydrolase (TIGR01509 family)